MRPCEGQNLSEVSDEPTRTLIQNLWWLNNHKKILCHHLFFCSRHQQGVKVSLF